MTLVSSPGLYWRPIRKCPNIPDAIAEYLAALGDPQDGQVVCELRQAGPEPML